jgi:hypothetical protein
MIEINIFVKNVNEMEMVVGVFVNIIKENHIV